MDLESQYCAHNCHPLPVVLTHGEEVFVLNEYGKKYLDMMSADSEASHGHAHPRLLRLVEEQVARLTIAARAFCTNTLAPFRQRGPLSKQTRMTAVGLAPPLVVRREEIDRAVTQIREALDEMNEHRMAS